MSKKKINLIKNLENDIYCKIMPSKIHGVGVFAIKDIPKNTNPFKISGNICSNVKSVKINKNDLKNVPNQIIYLLDDFIGIDDESYYIPKYGLNSLDISFYMNHSKKNNIDILEIDECEFTIFKTNKFIKKGKELFINYDKFK